MIYFYEVSADTKILKDSADTRILKARTNAIHANRRNILITDIFRRALLDTSVFQSSGYNLIHFSTSSTYGYNWYTPYFYQDSADTPEILEAWFDYTFYSRWLVDVILISFTTPTDKSDKLNTSQCSGTMPAAVVAAPVSPPVTIIEGTASACWRDNNIAMTTMRMTTAQCCGRKSSSS